MERFLALYHTPLFSIGTYTFQVANLVGILLVVVGTALARWLIGRFLKRNSLINKLPLEQEQRHALRGLLRYLVYFAGVLFLFPALGFDLHDLLGTRILSLPQKNEIKVINLVTALLVFAGARLGVWYFHRLFVRLGESKRIPIDQGRRMAFYQIIKYIVYVVAVFLILTSLHINLNWLIASSAALFVGVGLALQHVFDDFMSGLIILFEGTMEVGDMVHLDSIKLEGKVIEIRIRTTVIETLDGVSVIVPNSKITSTNVINWNFNDRETRFHVKVQVAYGSDIARVREALIDVAHMHDLVLSSPEPRVRMTEFGEYALKFELLFWTNHTYAYEDIMSDLRFMIEATFQQRGIRIPFPQRDLHIRSDFRQETDTAFSDLLDTQSAEE
ncbi:MAG: hypothetical protein OHK0039_05340 [Bacteroidia bacterium]